MIKHALRATALIVALGVCFTAGMLIGRSRVANELFVSFTEDPTDVVTDYTAGADSDIGININTATAAQLTDLPGIGDTLAQNIVAYREENGNFKAIEDIMLVVGIGQSRFEQIKAYITVGG